MNIRKQAKLMEIQNHNRKFEKLKALRESMKGDKHEWVVRVFGTDMSEELIEKYIATFTKE